MYTERAELLLAALQKLKEESPDGKVHSTVKRLCGLCNNIAGRTLNAAIGDLVEGGRLLYTKGEGKNPGIFELLEPENEGFKP